MTFPSESVPDRVTRCEKALHHLVAAIDGLRLDINGCDAGLHPEVQVHLEAAARELGLQLMPGTREVMAGKQAVQPG